MNSKKIAVAMSIYKKDSVTNVKLALDSLLLQDYDKFDVFIQVDGYVEGALEVLLDKYSMLSNFFIEKCEENQGLAFQLNKIISKVFFLNHYAFIARMDADDICEPNRFLEQVAFFERNPEVAVLGSDVIEFNDNKPNSNFYKKMAQEHETLSRDLIKRCPFNHPTVMFNLSVISPRDLLYNAALKNTQDYYLWVDLLSKGYSFANLNIPLLRFRLDDDFYSRRGYSKAKNDFKSRLYAMNKLSRWNFSSCFYTFLLIGVRLSPTIIKKMAYKFFR